MAEEKITIVDIRKAIARQMSLPSDTAGKFLNALFPAIIDGLKRDKMVRISGLGCFKLVWVEPRKSVNVTTGESIVLDGYNKLTFIPDSYIREQINEPFAELEAVRVDENGQPMEPQSTLPGLDPRVRFGEQAQEIVGLLADLGQDVNNMPEEPEEAEIEPQPTEPQLQAEVTEEPDPEVEESETEEAKVEETEGEATEEEPLEYMTEELLPIVEDKPAEESAKEPAGEPTKEEPAEKQPVKEVIEEKTAAEEPKAPVEDLGPFFDTKGKKKDDGKGFNGWIVAIVTIVVLLAMLVAGYFILVNKLEKWANSLGVEETDPLEGQLQDIPEDTIEMLAIEPLQPLDSTPAEAKPAAKTATPATVSADNMDILAVETVSKGSRLTLIALKHYGKKDLWVYIYEANRDVIKNPSKLVAGTKLRIPRLTDDVMNMSDEELKALHDKYIHK